MNHFNQFSTDGKDNEFEIFLQYNESGVNNIVVYLFWLTVSVVFNDFDHISFPKEFIDEVRIALNDQYRIIYFNYLLRLKQSLMDAIIDILPFFLAEVIK